jgi:BirA family biotin operon repressor/biotin-[acetyl-CoA-carboxylase] ligase
VIGTPRAHHRVADSTNQRARELAAAGAPHGTLVTADEQTAGRGRQGRAWVAPPGTAVLASVVVREVSPMLPLAAAVAVCEACEAVADVRCEIKWPNDVLIDGRKVCGILAEGRPVEGWAVIGIGLNVTAGADAFPPELRDTATSLHAASASRPTVAETIETLLPALGARLDTPQDELLDAWRARDALRGRRIAWNGGEGVAAGIDDSGALLVETGDGLATLDAGEVHLRRY